MASDIKITDLHASGGAGQIIVSASWAAPVGKSSLPYMRPERIEFWAAPSNNRAAAIKVAEGSALGIAIHDGLGEGETYSYWARAIDPASNQGDFHPVSPTAGVMATTKALTPGPGSITEAMLADGAVSTRAFVVGITPVEIAPSLPASGNYPGRMVYYAGKLYRHQGSPAGASGFTAAVDGGDITIGSISAAKMAVSQLSAISTDFGTMTAGTIYGVTINGAVINGGVLQSAPSGARVVVGPDNAVTVINSALAVIARLGAPSPSAPPLVIDNSGGQAARIRCSHTSYGVTVENFGDGTGLYVNATGDGSEAEAIRGQAGSFGGLGVVGAPFVAGGAAFRAVRGGYAPFTGVHDALLPRDQTIAVGDIVVASGRVIAKSGVSDSLLEVRGGAATAERGAYGVVASVQDFDPKSLIAALPPVNADDPPTPVRLWIAEKFKRLAVNGCGEGLVSVCGRGGDIAVGDYICTSSLAGKGQRQNDDSGAADDLLRRCTVAQATQNLSFADPDEVKLVACVYKCG